MRTLRLKEQFLLIGIFTFVGVLTGCENMIKPKGFGEDPVPKTGQTSSALSSSTDWRCPEPGSFNITPSSGRLGTDGSFTACRAANDPSRIKLSGLTRSAAICVYPMSQSIGSSNISLVDQRKCYAIGSGPIVIQFNSSQVNHLYIVDSQFTNAMEACLNGPSECPPYSAGSLY